MEREKHINNCRFGDIPAVYGRDIVKGKVNFKNPMMQQNTGLGWFIRDSYFSRLTVLENLMMGYEAKIRHFWIKMHEKEERNL